MALKLQSQSGLTEEFDSKTLVLTIWIGGLKFQTTIDTRRKVDHAQPLRWRWHARASNGKIVATAGESFARRGNAERAMRSFIENTRA